MDFKTKLGFLRSPTRRTEAELASDAELELTTTPTPPPASGIIEQLRAKMAEILERAPLEPAYPAPRVGADPSQTSLPFTREESVDGPLYRRHVILPPSHHVGRIPVDAAFSSRPELL